MVNFPRRIKQWTFVIALALGAPNAAWAGCSGYVGSAVLNEYFFGTGSDIPFIEAVFNKSIPSSVYSTWTVKVVGGVSGTLGTAGACTWGSKVFAATSFSSNALPFYGTVLLLDANNNVIDMLVADKKTPTAGDTSCPAVNDTASATTNPYYGMHTLVTSSSGTKGYARGPDMTGKWYPESGTGSGTGNTKCSPNSGLGIAKSVIVPANALPLIGDTVTYQAELTNQSGTTKTNISVTDSMDAGLSYVAGSAVPGAGNTFAFPTWTIASIGNNSIATLSLQGQIACSVAKGTVLNNTVSVATTDLYGNSINAMDSAAVTVQPFDHFEYSWTGVPGCGAMPVTLKACRDAACSQNYSSCSVAASLTPASAWPSTAATLTGGTASLSMNALTAGTYTIGATSAMAGAGATLCDNGASKSSANCTFTVGACPVIDHYEIVSSSSSGVTCAPNTLTIKACANSACSSLYAGGGGGVLTVTSFPAPTVNWITGPGFTTGASGTAMVQLQITSPGTVTFGVTPGAPAPTGARTCNLGGSASCDFNVASSGFLVNVANGLACNSQQVSLQAVKAPPGDVSACVPAFQNVSRNVSLWASYANPATGTKQASVNGTPIATASPGTQISNVAFNASGVATLSLTYPDAGQLGLGASYTGSAGTGDSGLSMTGNGTFITAPAAFAFAIQQKALPNKLNPASTSASDSNFFVPAGEPFNGTVTAFNACATPAATANFGKEIVPESVTTSWSRYLPGGAHVASGPSDGVFVKSGSVGAFSNGVATTPDFLWSEVGIINLTATLANPLGYLASGLIPTGSTYVGRFIPAYFDTAVTPGCGSVFTYSGQPFTSLVTAMSKPYNNPSTGVTASTKTVNYAGGFGFSRDVALSDGSGTTMGNLGSVAIPYAFTAGNVALPAANFASGIGTLDATASGAAAFLFASSRTPPTPIILRSVEKSPGGDGVTSNVSAVTYPSHQEGTASIYSGRARLQNAYGSELLNLPVPFRLEYWQDATSAWQVNSSDTCTIVTPANFAFAFPAGTAGKPNNLSACETAITVAGSPPGYALTLSRPGSGNDGWTDMTLNLGVAASGTQCSLAGGAGSASTTANSPWLQYNWTGTVGNPSARATFGIYKPPVIYRRENY